MASLPTIGGWSPQTERPVLYNFFLMLLIELEPCIVLTNHGAVGVGFGGHYDTDGQFPLIGSIARCIQVARRQGIHEIHGVRFPYVGGAMANGIATKDL